MFVHEFLEKSRKSTPEKTALIQGDQRVSYQELDEMAARFASALIDQGIDSFTSSSLNGRIIASIFFTEPPI